MDLTDKRIVIAGLCSGQIGMVDMTNINNVLCLGEHDAPICKVVWIEKFQIVVSFGYDNVIKVFTMSPQNNTNNFQIA